MGMKLERVPLPVSDVDRAKAFYTEQVGCHADLDETFGEHGRGHGRPGKPTVSYTYVKDPDDNSWALQKLPY